MILEFIGLKDAIIATSFLWIYELEKSCNRSGESIGLIKHMPKKDLGIMLLYQ